MSIRTQVGRLIRRVEVGYRRNRRTQVVPFRVTGTLTASAAATPVVLIPDSDVPAGFKVFVTSFLARVNGATNWATTANVKIQDTNATPVDFVTMLVAALTGNARVLPGSANTTLEDAMSLMTGGTTGRGLQVRGNANGTGSDLVVTVLGFMEGDLPD